MYCLKCGKKIDDNASFCPYCGTQQKKTNLYSKSDSDKENSNEKESEPLFKKESNNDESTNTINLDSDEDQDLFFGDSSSDYDVDDNNEDENEKDENQKVQYKTTYNPQYTNNQNRSSTNRPMWLFIAIGIIIVAIIVVLIVVLSNSKPTIDMNKYLVVTDEGYNGYGSVNYYIDYTQLYNDYAGKLKLTSEGNNNYIFSRAMIVNGEDPVEMICDDLSVHPDVYSDLSNGDKVIFTWDDSEISMIETYIKVNIKAKDYTYTVSNLEDIEKDDFFNYISIEYSGIAPNGTASINVNEDCDWLDSYDFSIDDTNNLSNGDTITVTINDYALQSIMYQYGKAPIETEKEYTVEGLSYYSTSLDDLSDSMLEKMQDKAIDALNNEISGSSEYTTINQINYLGCLLYEPKDSKDSEGNNYYLIYDVLTTTSCDGETQVYDRYWYTCFHGGFINNEDGSFSMNIDDYSIPECSYSNYSGLKGEGFTLIFPNSTFYYGGSKTLDGLKSSIAEANSNLLDSSLEE